MNCDWASCQKNATAFCGQWWHCQAHYELHLEFEREANRPTLVESPGVPKQRGRRPITSTNPLAEYKRTWMANKRARLKAEAAAEKERFESLLRTSA